MTDRSVPALQNKLCIPFFTFVNDAMQTFPSHRPSEYREVGLNEVSGSVHDPNSG